MQTSYSMYYDTFSWAANKQASELKSFLKAFNQCGKRAIT